MPFTRKGTISDQHAVGADVAHDAMCCDCVMEVVQLVLGLRRSSLIPSIDAIADRCLDNARGQGC
jgi:hypothetical protein